MLSKKMKNKCELCKSTATIYCDSDRASLCWTCDATVHSANFLVAKHPRNLLCHVCHALTPWTASGEKLSPSTVSVCRKCVVKGVSDDDDKEERVGCNDGEICTESNQVVRSSREHPPPPMSSSSNEEVSMKRKRPNVPDLNSEDELDCSSVNINGCTFKATDGNRKRTLNQDIICGEYMSERVYGASKSTRTLEFDLNSSP